MSRKYTPQGLMGMMLSPEMRGLTNYLNGRIMFRDSGGHPGGPGGDDDSDEDADEDDDDADDDADEDDSDDDEDRKPKSKKSKGDDSDDDESVPAWKHDKIVARLAAADKAKGELQKQLDRLKSEGVKDEDVKREVAEVKARAERVEAESIGLRQRIAFLSTKVKGIEWADPADAMALIDFKALDAEDGNVDPRAMRSAVRDLARRKPYLLADKPKAKDDEDGAGSDDDSGGTRSTRTTARPVNKRRGGKPTRPSAAELAKQFPSAFR